VGKVCPDSAKAASRENKPKRKRRIAHTMRLVTSIGGAARSVWYTTQ
jgi:hypothetical protein